MLDVMNILEDEVADAIAGLGCVVQPLAIEIL
jgi:hypothetical protein